MEDQVKFIDFIDALLINALLIIVLTFSIQTVHPLLTTTSSSEEEVVMQAVAVNEVVPPVVKPIKSLPKVVETTHTVVPPKVVPPVVPPPVKTVEKRVVVPPKETKVVPPKETKKVKNDKGECLDNANDDSPNSNKRPCKKTKQQLIQERKFLEQQKLQEANRKAQEKAAQERQKIEEAKRKAKQIDEQKRLAKDLDKKKKAEDKRQEQIELAKAEKAKQQAKQQAKAAKKRQEKAATEPPTQAAVEAKQKAQQAAQEAAEAKKQQRAAEKARQAAAAAKEKRQAAAETDARRKAAEADGRKKAAAEAAKKRAEAAQKSTDNQALIGQVAGRIRAKIRGQWVKPAGTAGLSCAIAIQLAPGGAVGSAQIVRSSGNAVFDSAALAAVRRASPLPVPNEVFNRFRRVNITLN